MKERLKHNAFVNFLLKPYRRLKRWVRDYKSMNRMIDRYVGSEIRFVERKALQKKMKVARKKYKFAYDEYFLYHVSELSSDECMQFVPDVDRMAYCERLNKKENQPIFDDKEKTYQYFGKYYGRELMFGGGTEAEADFLKFVKDRSRIIVKPRDDFGGHGVRVVTVEKGSERELFHQLLADYKKGFIAEAFIVQSEEIANLHPQSVNTVRIPTVRFDDRIEIIHPFFRVGRGEAVVDNAFAGGIIAAVDVETGMVIAAADELGNRFVEHPDTKLPIIGYKIPHWEEAKSLAKELAQVIPDNRYAGWDLALTDNGWIMVEGNARGQFVFQIPLQKGFRTEIESILAELQL